MATMAYREVAAGEPPSAIHTHTEHRRWKKILDALMLQAAQDGATAAENRYIETIALLIEAYEKQQFLMPRVAPEEMIVELMELHGMKQRDLVDVFKSEAAVSYALSGKRALTVEQIRGLAKKFHVSPAVFIE